jgi:DNA-binding NtrC family response regulator
MRHQPIVLVADDDESIIFAFKEFFRKEHWTMMAASNAEDALTIIADRPLDLLITDVLMKAQSGVTLMLKARHSHPGLPVIVITGHPDAISEADIRLYGADFVFVKPLDLVSLREAINDCLHRSAHRPNGSNP